MGPGCGTDPSGRRGDFGSARPATFLTKARLEKTPLLSPKYFVDLSIPRSIETSIEEIPGAFV